MTISADLFKFNIISNEPLSIKNVFYSTMSLGITGVFMYYLYGADTQIQKLTENKVVNEDAQLNEKWQKRVNELEDLNTILSEDNEKLKVSNKNNEDLNKKITELENKNFGLELEQQKLQKKYEDTSFLCLQYQTLHKDVQNQNVELIGNNKKLRKLISEEKASAVLTIE